MLPTSRNLLFAGLVIGRAVSLIPWDGAVARIAGLVFGLYAHSTTCALFSMCVTIRVDAREYGARCYSEGEAVARDEGPNLIVG